MRIVARTLILMMLTCSGLCQQAGVTNFDGMWDTVLTCPNNVGAMGYSFRFPASVKDGVLNAAKGEKGKAGWLQIEGKIEADGVAKLYLNGLVGASEFAVGQRPAGTEYGYHIDAKFAGDEGRGKRVEGRPCSVTFTRTK